jgi:hypothetical protein
MLFRKYQPDNFSYQLVADRNLKSLPIVFPSLSIHIRKSHPSSFGISYSPWHPVQWDFKTQFSFSPAKLFLKIIIKPHKVYFQTKTPFNHLKLQNP